MAKMARPSTAAAANAPKCNWQSAAVWREHDWPFPDSLSPRRQPMRLKNKRPAHPESFTARPQPLPITIWPDKTRNFQVINCGRYPAILQARPQAPFAQAVTPEQPSATNNRGLKSGQSVSRNSYSAIRPIARAEIRNPRLRRWCGSRGLGRGKNNGCRDSAQRVFGRRYRGSSFQSPHHGP